MKSLVHSRPGRPAVDSDEHALIGCHPYLPVVCRVDEDLCDMLAGHDVDFSVGRHVVFEPVMGDEHSLAVDPESHGLRVCRIEGEAVVSLGVRILDPDTGCQEVLVVPAPATVVGSQDPARAGRCVDALRVGRIHLYLEGSPLRSESVASFRVPGNGTAPVDSSRVDPAALGPRIHVPAADPDRCYARRTQVPVLLPPGSPPVGTQPNTAGHVGRCDAFRVPGVDIDSPCFALCTEDLFPGVPPVQAPLHAAFGRIIDIADPSSLVQVAFHRLPGGHVVRQGTAQG